MPHFYFIVHDQWGEAADEEGAELPDFAGALLHAAAGARSMMSHSIQSGELDLSAFVDVQDVNRNFVTRLYFDEAVNVRTR